MNHGEAVAAGMAIVAQIAEKSGILQSCDRERIMGMLERYGFELTAPVTMRKLINAISKDKKMAGEYLNLVLPTGIGSCEVHRIPKNEAANLLSK